MLDDTNGGTHQKKLGEKFALNDHVQRAIVKKLAEAQNGAGLKNKHGKIQR
jgi:hypothetical protein